MKGASASVFILNVPFEERHIAAKHGATYKSVQGWVFPGDDLPSELHSYLPPRHSWEHYMMHSGRGNTAPAEDTGDVVLREDQKNDIAELKAGFAAGAPEVLIASKTGTGKTYVALNLAMQLPGSGKVLIICPKSVIPSWRRSIEMVHDHGKRFVITNYESAKKLLKPLPPGKNDRKRAKTKSGERNRKTRLNNAHATKGIPFVSWDVIIFDEAHYLGNPESQRTRVAQSLIHSAKRTPKVIKVSATIGAKPTKLAHLAPSLAWVLGEPRPKITTQEAWDKWLEEHGFHFTSTRWGKQWEHNQEDLDRIHGWLFQSPVTWAVRADPGWDDVRRYQLPIELTELEERAYEVAWEEFKATMRSLPKLASQSSEGKREAQQKGLAARIRYQQKVGILKAPYIGEYIRDALEGDTQVAVSAEYLTTVQAIQKSLGKSIPVALFTGRNPEDREEQRAAFQRGDRRVIIFTPSEGFDLHEGAPGGNTVPRIQVCAEPSWSPIKGRQKEGRTNRNGKSAPVIYPSAVGTIDEQIIGAQMQGFASIDTMMGDQASVMSPLSELVGVSPEFLG